MVDWYIILVPLLLLPVIGLLRFIGCNQVWGLNPTILVTDSTDVNCGGPSIDPFQADPDDGGSHTDYFSSNGGKALKLADPSIVTDGHGNPISPVYATGRSFEDFSYDFGALENGGYLVTLKFAEIGDAQKPGDRVFAIEINGAPALIQFDIIALAGGRLIAHDERIAVHVDDVLSIGFQGLSGTPLVNAIQVEKADVVTLTPTSITLFSGQTQQFSAVANWDPAAPVTWDLSHSFPSGQISPGGLYGAPTGLLAPTQETVIATASSGNDHATATAEVSIYLQNDPLTRGAWRNKYGVDGFVLAKAIPDSQFPSYVDPQSFIVTRMDGSAVDVFNAGQTGDVRVLVDPTGTNTRPNFMWDDVDGRGLTFSFRFTDAKPHLFGVYCFSFDGENRIQSFQMSQLDVGQVQSYTDIKLVDAAHGVDGLYLFWIGSGRIQLSVQTGGGSTGINNVVNGVFFR